MYGLVNQGVQDLAVQLGGDDLWEKIKQRAGVDVEAFVGMEVYPDDITERLVLAAAATLDLSPADVLRTFGRHWILYTARKGYGAVFETMGRTLPEFLGNLDAMHARLSLSMPHLEPPSFVCEQLENGRLRLEYWTERTGLAPMVVGLIEGLAESFDLHVRMTQTMSKDDGADHDEFLVETLPAQARVASPADAR
jgi:hypothetical protein